MQRVYKRVRERESLLKVMGPFMASYKIEDSTILKASKSRPNRSKTPLSRLINNASRPKEAALVHRK